MNIGYIAQPNTKGQIVIPKDVRKKIGITSGTPLQLIIRGNGVYITPIAEVLGKGEADMSYIEVLKKTQGAWKNEQVDPREEKRRILELTSTKKLKRAW